MMRTILSVLVLIVLAGAGYALYTHYARPEPVTDFSATGTLVRDTPGLTPGTWYLVYEAPGAPALTTSLSFDAKSSCSLGVCDPETLTVGTRATVRGISMGTSSVLVRSLELATTTESGMAVRLYYYDPARDTDASSTVLCSARGLVPVERVIPKNDDPIKETISLLLRGELSDEERSQGITTEFPLAGVALTNVDRSPQGTVTLSFADPNNRTSGGSCRVSILWKEIEATVKQFPGVTSVRFSPATLFQP